MCRKGLVALAFFLASAIAARLEDPQELLEHLQAPAQGCLAARLLVLDFEPYDGLATSVVKVASALAEAYYSDRVLVLGPTPLKNTHNIVDDCGGHSYFCTFQSLGPCSFSDVSVSDLKELAEHGYKELSRVKWSEQRRGGVAQFVPPRPVADMAGSQRHAQRLWLGALYGYAARLRPETAAHVSSFRSHLDFKRPLVGLQVDHSGESANIPFSKFFASIAKKASHAETIYVSTDDSTLMEHLHEVHESAAHAKQRIVALERLRVDPGHCFVDCESELSPPQLAQEQLEDLMMLVQADVLVGAGSSALTMVAQALRWSRGADDAPVLVDGRDVATGKLRYALLPHVAVLPPGKNREQNWEVAMLRFYTGALRTFTPPGVVDGVKFSPAAIPELVSLDLFEQEVARWHAEALCTSPDASVGTRLDHGRFLVQLSHLSNAHECLRLAFREARSASEDERLLRAAIRSLQEASYVRFRRVSDLATLVPEPLESPSSPPPMPVPVPGPTIGVDSSRKKTTSNAATGVVKMTTSASVMDRSLGPGRAPFFPVPDVYDEDVVQVEEPVDLIEKLDIKSIPVPQPPQCPSSPTDSPIDLAKKYFTAGYFDLAYACVTSEASAEARALANEIQRIQQTGVGQRVPHGNAVPLPDIFPKKLTLSFEPTPDHTVYYEDGSLPASLCEYIMDLFDTSDFTPALSTPHSRVSAMEFNVSASEDARWRQVDWLLLQLVTQQLYKYEFYNKASNAFPSPLHDEGFVVRRYANNGKDEHHYHTDATDLDRVHRVVGFILCLNTIDDGGEHIFHRQGDNIEAKQGRTILFPTAFTYANAARMPYSGYKYVVYNFLSMKPTS